VTGATATGRSLVPFGAATTTGLTLAHAVVAGPSFHTTATGLGRRDGKSGDEGCRRSRHQK